MVEDRAEDAELAIRELRRAELECQTERVDKADAFRRALVEFRPDIVLADYTVPGFGGMAALEILKTDAPTIPLIVVTGSLDEETAAECIKAGAADYVLKTNLIRLEPAINGAIAFSQGRAARPGPRRGARAAQERHLALPRRRVHQLARRSECRGDREQLSGRHGSPHPGRTSHSVAEDGSHRPAGGRRGARFQQHPHRDRRIHRSPARRSSRRRSPPPRCRRDLS